jgi:hypothetical protein
LQRGLVPIPVGPDKRPLVRWEPFQLEPPHADQIDEWWRRWPEANIGVVTGQVSGVVVLDADGPEGLESLKALHTPATTWLSRTGRGWHQWFAHPGVTIGNRAGVRPHLDVRGDGGYVVAPPSLHASGQRYEWLTPPERMRLAPLPEDVLALLTAPAAASVPSTGEIPQGQRNDVLYRIARGLVSRGLSDGAVHAAVAQENRARCRPPLPDREVRDLVEHAIRQPHRPDFGRAAHVNGSASRALLTRLSTVEAESVDWLWRNRIARGKLALNVGDVGQGKTFLNLDIAARLTTGRPWPDGDPAPNGHVILLTSEDGIADTLRPRIDQLAGDPNRIDVLRAVHHDDGESPFTLESDLPALDTAIEQTGAITVFVDPLSAYLGSRDSYKDSEIRGLLTPLAALAERRRVAIIGNLHLTKAQQRRMLYSVNGSVAFVAQARTVLAVGEDPEVPGRRLLAPLKNNLGPMPAILAFRISDSGLTWEAGTIEGTADRLFAHDEPGTRTEQRERDQAAKFLLDLLRDGPIASKQVMADATANGIAQRTLWRAKADLGIISERTRTTEGNTGPWYWALAVRA